MYPRYQLSRQLKTLRITSGDYATGSVGFGWREPFGSTKDLTIDVQVGDILEVALGGSWQPAGGGGSIDYLDIICVTSYQHLGDGTTGAITTTTGTGFAGWLCNNANSNDGITGSVFYAVTAPDIGTNNRVVLRIISRTTSGRTLNASSTTPLSFTAKNLGPSDDD